QGALLPYFIHVELIIFCTFRDPSNLVCCPGWRQEGNECTIPVCEGEQACLKNEICVYPGVCRCPPGYYGAHCKTRCSSEFWASDCRQVCLCHPHGQCHPVTGECTCKVNRWGPLCQHTCKCGRHGRCHPVHGNCTCDEGWWTPSCSKPCQCNSVGSVGPGCDQLMSRCQCRKGHWGMKCSAPCNCYTSPCNQRTGTCECEADWWGQNCDLRCNCDVNHSVCDPTNGNCLCHPGYQGAYCNKPCGSGMYGSGCKMSCGHCEGNQICSATDGACAACEPGWNGTRCDRPCPSGYYGHRCQAKCPHCRNDEPCDPLTGKCGRSAILAGVLVPLFLLLLAVLCCCLCCGGAPVDSKDRSEFNLCGPLVHLTHFHAIPTVSHHDPELTFNHSFIEPPSSGWVTEGSSFDSDEEEGEALYCVPPREDIPAVAGGEFQEMSSKCNMFLDPSGFSSEDITSPFNIPRTSSIAKSKRPSVSFAEGTRFSPKERRGSAQEPGALIRNKPKSTWGVLMLSALQSQGSVTKPGDEDADECEEKEEEVDALGASGRRRTMSNTAANKSAQQPTSGSDAQVGASNKVTTVYVTVGKAGRPVSETSSEGPVQAMLRRLGSLQRQRDQESGKIKSKGGEGIIKPPRRKLGARASVWEQGGPSGGEESICKPIRRKHASHNSSDSVGTNDTPSEGGTPKRPLSSILKTVPEVSSADSGLRAEGDSRQDSSKGVTESTYLTVGPAGNAATLAEVIANEGAVVSVSDEPCYENVMINHS
uniref:Scavenger receptor class F, member 1 n=1 Tax=Echeneis naucrates TaxID=173247 RepID=A0A665UTI5_ECHNA